MCTRLWFSRTRMLCWVAVLILAPACALADDLFTYSAYLPIGLSGPRNPFLATAMLADCDADGTSDLVLADVANNRGEIRHGLGAGRFGDPQYFATGEYPYSLEVGDVTGDGNLDVVVENVFDYTISVLPGNGDGTLATQIVLPTIPAPRRLTLGDVDQDGHLDILVCT